jgi:hypothetical protein
MDLRGIAFSIHTPRVASDHLCDREPASCSTQGVQQSVKSRNFLICLNVWIAEAELPGIGMTTLFEEEDGGMCCRSGQSCRSWLNQFAAVDVNALAGSESPAWIFA